MVTSLLTKDSKLNFQNTQIAFASKSNAELQKKYWLFSLMNSPLLTNLGTASTEIGLSLGLPIKYFVKNTVFKLFCGGETIEECELVIRDLGKSNIGSILDYSIEGKSEEAAFESTKQEFLRVLRRSKGDKNVPFAVFKVTGLARFELLEKVDAKQDLTAAEQAEWETAKNRVRDICKFAHEIDQAIFIDAEESWIQDAVDELTTAMMREFNREKPLIYNTIQLYRHDRLEFLKKSHAQAVEGNYFLGVKLVRGAYMEKERKRAEDMNYPSPIQPSKEASDRDYDFAVEFCVQNIDHISFVAGSHNEDSIQKLIDLMRAKNLPNNHAHAHFSQLYGMSDNLSYVLAAENYNVSKYVPYGPVKDAMPYLIRRAKENTAVMGQMSRELDLIDREIKRRKNVNG